jgi:hypothetical protein
MYSLYIALCILYLVYSIRNTNKIKSIDYNVKTYKTNNKKEIETIIKQNKNPIVFIDVPAIETLDKPTLFNHLNLFFIPNYFTYNFTANTNEINTTTPIKKNIYHRHTLLCNKGSIKLIIFNTNQESSLYIKSNVVQSPVNFWNVNLSEFPLMKQIRYIEIIIHDNQLVYIPYGWWYTMYYLEKSTIIEHMSESYLSHFIQIIRHF